MDSVPEGTNSNPEICGQEPQLKLTAGLLTVITVVLVSIAGIWYYQAGHDSGSGESGLAGSAIVGLLSLALFGIACITSSVGLWFGIQAGKHQKSVGTVLMNTINVLSLLVSLGIVLYVVISFLTWNATH
jgi:hypothetical protein